MASKGVKGVSSVISQLRKFGKDAEKLIDAETEAIAFQIEGDAKRLAPKNFGKLAQSISHEKIKLMLQKVTVNELYGAYMEFGTGTKVNVPAEFKDIALSFKDQKTGTFEQGLEAIKIWCRSKGIDEKAAYPIFAKILGAGINPHPFLYPAYQKGKKDYVKNLQRVLKQMNKKI
jgi:HK97 gp10 family phage protein